MSRQRNISLDILRIISMLMIVMMHAQDSKMGFADVNVVPFTDPKWYLLYGVASFSFVSVNCFILITGYFLSNAAEISYKKLIRLWITIFTYSFGFYFLLCVVPFAGTSFSLSGILHSVFSISFKNNWFFTDYFILYAVAPFLNKMCNSLEEKDFRKLLIVLCMFFVVIPTLFNDYQDSRNGYSVIWFVVLYLTGAYISRFQLPKIKYGLVYLLCSVIIFISIGISVFTEKYGVNIGDHLLKYNSIIVYPSSIALFMFFKNQNKNYSQKNSAVICKISSLTIGVCLFHEHEYIKPILWQKLLRLNEYQNNNVLFFIRFFVGIILIYIIGLIIEYCRASLYSYFINFIDKNKNKRITTNKE